MKFFSSFPRIAFFIAGLAGFSLHAADAVKSMRVESSFDAQWHFLKGDAPGAEKADFADASWRMLDVPHDWGIEGPFAETNLSGKGGAYLPTGVSWYRKSFTLSADDAARRVFIDFDGVMANSEVWINGFSLGKRPYGFVSFRYELTGHLNFGTDKPNTIAVRTDTTPQPASHFYAGDGIYRHVRLVVTDPVHLDHWGVFVTTPKISPTEATVHVQATVVNNSDKDQTVSVVTTLVDSNLKPTTAAPQTIPAGKSAVFEHDITVANPKLWDIASPNLYHAKVQVMVADAAVDGETVDFGIRSFEFKADTGFWLNGRNLKIYGMCLHEDGGAFGMAVPASVWERRLLELRQIGVNAIRTVHNPPAPEFLALCDRLGFLVMLETFDAWKTKDGDATFGYQVYFDQWWKTDLHDIVLRDRNHPSIILYSLGNEIRDNFTEDAGRNTFLGLRDWVHQLDSTRPVTFSLFRPNDPSQKVYDNGFADLMDIIGQDNRETELIDAWNQKPTRKVIGTATDHKLSTWQYFRDNPFFSGQFIFSGMDYLGEAEWPLIGNAQGMFDRVGGLKTDGMQRESWWSSTPFLHLTRYEDDNGKGDVVHNWTPADPEAYSHASIAVYSNCDTVEVFLNDVSLGVKRAAANQPPRKWNIAYKPGVLKAVGKNEKGEVVSTEELRTAGAPAKIVLAADRAQITHSFEDVAFVTAFVADKDGVPCGNGEEMVSFKISGPGVIAAVDNADNGAHEPFQASQRTTYRGQCVAFVKASAPGKITLTASAPDLADGTITIDAVPADAK